MASENVRIFFALLCIEILNVGHGGEPTTLNQAWQNLILVYQRKAEVWGLDVCPSIQRLSSFASVLELEYYTPAHVMIGDRRRDRNELVHT